MSDIIAHLEQVIAARRPGADGPGADASYVASLFAKGRDKMAQKLGEEAVEAVIAASRDESDAMIGEAADLVFHLLVLLNDMDLSWADIMQELERREGVSGLDEKASRTAR